MEDDGVVADPVTLHVTVTISGDEMIVDWTGTDPQVRGPINATYGVTAGATFNAVFHLRAPRVRRVLRHYHLEGGGWGAKSYDDGNDAIIVKNGNCRNTPVEIFETRHPLRVLEYSLGVLLRASAPTGGAGALACEPGRSASSLNEPHNSSRTS